MKQKNNSNKRIGRLLARSDTDAVERNQRLTPADPRIQTHPSSSELESNWADGRDLSFSASVEQDKATDILMAADDRSTEQPSSERVRHTSSTQSKPLRNEQAHQHPTSGLDSSASSTVRQAVSADSAFATDEPRKTTRIRSPFADDPLNNTSNHSSPAIGEPQQTRFTQAATGPIEPTSRVIHPEPIGLMAERPSVKHAQATRRPSSGNPVINPAPAYSPPVKLPTWPIDEQPAASERTSAVSTHEKTSQPPTHSDRLAPAPVERRSAAHTKSDPMPASDLTTLLTRVAEQQAEAVRQQARSIEQQEQHNEQKKVIPLVAEKRPIEPKEPPQNLAKMRPAEPRSAAQSKPTSNRETGALGTAGGRLNSVPSIRIEIGKVTLNSSVKTAPKSAHRTPRAHAIPLPMMGEG